MCKYFVGIWRGNQYGSRLAIWLSSLAVAYIYRTMGLIPRIGVKVGEEMKGREKRGRGERKI